jgi:hypothetical protein
VRRPAIAAPSGSEHLKSGFHNILALTSGEAVPRTIKPIHEFVESVVDDESFGDLCACLYLSGLFAVPFQAAFFALTLAHLAR